MKGWKRERMRERWGDERTKGMEDGWKEEGKEDKERKKRMDGRVDEEEDEKKDEGMRGRREEGEGRWMEGRTDGLMKDGRMNGWMDG